MKPHGPIPPGYSADADGMLIVGGERADALAARAGDTPLFVYDSALLKARVAEWRAAMPSEVQLHYAMKANPFAPLLTFMAGIVDGFDVASGGELAAALASGMEAEHISFAGPGKRDRELEAAIKAGATINLESAGEAERALHIAARLGARPRLAVRVNPDFDLKGSGMKMGGGAKPFGVDAEDVPALVRRLVDAGADWQGFHIFAGSQALSAAAIAETQAQTVALAARLANGIGAAPPLVNLGGGMGVPYFPGDSAVDTAAVGAALAETLAARDPVLGAVLRWSSGAGSLPKRASTSRASSTGRSATARYFSSPMAGSITSLLRAAISGRSFAATTRSRSRAISARRRSRRFRLSAVFVPRSTVLATRLRCRAPKRAIWSRFSRRAPMAPRQAPPRFWGRDPRAKSSSERCHYLSRNGTKADERGAKLSQY